MSGIFSYSKFFPYPQIRESQTQAIDFALDAFLNQNKKFVIVEAGTGVGKSAVGYAVAKYLDSQVLKPESKFLPGSYFITTQKILQEQYITDFGSGPSPMRSIKSSSNYKCSYNKKNSCGESQRLLKVADKKSPFFKACTFNCAYKKAKEDFLAAHEGVSNFSYFLAETYYSGKIQPRNLLVIDEAHNCDMQLSKFIEMSISEKFCNQVLSLKFPKKATQVQTFVWVKEIYEPKLKLHVAHMESILEKYSNLRDKLDQFVNLSQKYEMLDKHLCKLHRFLEIYEKENWIMNLVESDIQKSKKIEFKPVCVAPYSRDILFKNGEKILMMSATILDYKGFCEKLGVSLEDSAFISIPSPFPAENKPIIYSGIGRMSSSSIDTTLPKMADAVKVILENHKNEKGIIHCHSYKVAHFLKKNIRSSRLLMHNSDNRDQILRKHINSSKPTVLLSPSMTEGVDLKGDISRFQILCKVPYPYLGDKLIRKKMNKWKWWYPLQTAKTIVQSVGRSIRSVDDHAVTYILDSDWIRFYNKNSEYFPLDFKRSIYD
ncbi:MAG TPA: ATP-dependent DNA helicase [Flavobacteriales bacterium]|nr:ATP-dependent DNA helicase [Flavobacteriales bacterium]